MCGIVGLVYRDPSRPCDAERLTAMRDVVSYRGPDDAGIHCDGNVGLGHRRLSIIDLGGGHQPMSDASGATWIVYNGEVYNFRALRESLIASGHRFQTESDTEVILHLYAELGEDCVKRLNGMFAFAIWDAEQRSLFLARDRMGVKPLYYAETAQAFVFGSEIKSILASGVVSPMCREEALAEYLIFRHVAGSETLFRGVMSLPPGHTMTVRDGKSHVTRFWSPLPADGLLPISFEEARHRLASLLEESVQMRMISDVPLGTFCSGGLDSSLVTALAARLNGSPVNTFSVGFDEPDYDESAYADLVSKRYGSIHHQLRLGNADYSELFPRMVWHNDEPLNFANSVQIFALSQLARQYVTVVLTGEGSDELFAGYPRYRIPGLVRSYRHVPASVRRFLAAIIRDHRVEKLNRYASLSEEGVLLHNAGFLPSEEVAGLCPRLPAFDDARRLECLRRGDRPSHPVCRLSLLDQETYLVSILHRQDKMSMAASIESRVPFLDYRIVELANRLPAGYKLRRGVGKAIVKEVAAAVLPREIVDRRKSGFGVPLDRWFRARDGMGVRVAEMPESPGADVFDRGALRRLVEEHRAGTHDHSELLWGALNVCVWREAFTC